LLLSTQGWRRGIFANFKGLEERIMGLDKDSEERLRLEYLYARAVLEPEIMFDDMMPVPMMAMEAMGPPMEMEMAREPMNGGAMEDAP
jgi:hypothetical protein